MDAFEKKLRDLLTKVRDSDKGIGYPTEKAAAPAVSAGLLIANKGMIDGNNNAAHKLTEKGFNYLKSPEGTDVSTVAGDASKPFDPPTASGNAAAADTEGDGSTIGAVTNYAGKPFARAFVALPAIANQRKSGYPTDKLQAPVQNEDGEWVYDSLFLDPADTKVENPIKTYSAVAGAANKRHKADGRKFTSRVLDGAPWGKPGVEGVAIFRVDNK